MTVLSAGAPPPPPGPVRYIWAQVHQASDAFPCEHLHGRSGGRLDESARRLSHEELAAARLLADAGHDVHALPEHRGGGRRPDLLVCGSTLEVKSFVPVAERRRPPTAFSVLNKLLDAEGQAPHAVLVGTGSGLSEGTARRGVARYVADPDRGSSLTSVRVVGDGYDLAWARRPSLQVGTGLWAPPTGRTPDAGLGL